MTALPGAALLAGEAGSYGAQASFDLMATFVLVMLRCLGFLVIAPPLGSKLVPGRIKVALAMALAIPVTPSLVGTATFTDTWSLVGAAAYQAVTGLFLGFLCLMLVLAVQAAGDLIDIFSMFTMSSLLDPISNTNSGVFGRIHYLVGTTLLFASNGHLLLIHGLLSTFTVAPLHAPDLGDATKRLVDGFTTFFVAGLEIAGPVAVVLVLADLALGMVSRAVPSLNIFQLAFPVKTVLTVALASIAVALLPGAISSIVDRSLSQFLPLTRLLGG